MSRLSLISGCAMALSLLLTSPASPQSHCILYLDIDRLHVINETFGMHVGDDVIVSVADRMAKTLPPQALSARISGDRLAARWPQPTRECLRRPSPPPPCRPME